MSKIIEEIAGELDKKTVHIAFNYLDEMIRDEVRAQLHRRLELDGKIRELIQSRVKAVLDRWEKDNA